MLFGFPNDFQPFSPQKLFTAVNSNTTDVFFFIPGTGTATTTSAFAVIIVDVVMDDFLYAEPLQVPVPATLALTVLGLALVGTLSRRGSRRRAG